MNTKIIASLAIIAVVGAGAIGATRAYFSDTVTVTNSTMSAGTLDLKVDSNPAGNIQNWSDGFTSPIQLTKLVPGFTASQIVDIKELGDVDGNASIRFVLTSNKDKGATELWGGSLAQNMRVKVSYSPANNGTFGAVLYDYTLAEYHANPNQLLLGALTGIRNADNTADINDGKVASVKLEYYIPSSVENDIQGDSLSVNTIFGLEQTH